MVLICQANNRLLFAPTDYILEYNTEESRLEEHKLPKPVVPESLSKGQIEVFKKEKNTITAMECSKDGLYIAVTTENKQVVVFDKSFSVLNSFLLQRVAGKVCFSPSNDIVVADRTGDVYLYKLEGKSEPTLLLGHLSVILDMVISDCGRYIITCDRDEKIRVSHYPNAYNIIAYCLGHTEFIVCIKLLKNSNTLLSASGDGSIRIWNYLEGKELSIINTQNHVDKMTLDSFSTQMDSENVDINTLPILNMQVYEKYTIFIAVSLYNLNKIFLYKLERDIQSYTYMTNIVVNSLSFVFYFNLTNTLYILSDRLCVFELVEDNFKPINFEFLEEKLKQYKDLFVYDNNAITLLYKRRYDNVQEYLDKKRQRIESK